ncbi:MAG: tetratricopeptide repeat protein [Candidatus Omnitrophica bacterium]|nr:tetratricopeptide repeat protein [Candidatus Omnitrophota bacterium]MDD5553818.1 tetratricopeptide repeat protein [Candidatus Omnitrophota bacterium]
MKTQEAKEKAEKGCGSIFRNFQVSYKNRTVPIFILAAACFLLYANSLNNEFISDDIAAILNNPNISQVFYRLNPFNILNSLIYRVAGNNPFPHHLVNVVLHFFNTTLVFFFLRLFFKIEASFLGACLFAAHPIHTEAVTWISGRPYIITSIFILGAFLLYYRATGRGSLTRNRKSNVSDYLLSLVISSYYMFTSLSFYFAFPFFIILFDLTFGSWRRNWKWWLPFIAVTSIKVLLLSRNMIFQRIDFVSREIGQQAGPSNFIFNLAYSFFSHLGLLFWPARLTLYHEPAVISREVLGAEILVLVILAISLPFIFKRSKELFFGLGLFILFLAPTYSPFMVSWLVAERYLYFPSVILSILLAFIYEKKTSKQNGSAPILLGAAVFIICASGVRTVARNEDWKTQERFWRQTALVSNKSPRAHNNMGDVYGREGNLDAAIREFKKAIELRPNYADAYHNLAHIYHDKGNIEEAVKFYREAIFFNPDLFESRLNLGLIYMSRGMLDSARIELKEAARIRPQDENARKALAMAAG